MHPLLLAFVVLAACSAESQPHRTAPDATPDATPDAAPDYVGHCPHCGSGEICVVDYDGTRAIIGAHCVVSSCFQTCTPDCDALCQRDGGVFHCNDVDEPLPEGYFACAGP